MVFLIIEVKINNYLTDTSFSWLDDWYFTWFYRKQNLVCQSNLFDKSILIEVEQILDFVGNHQEQNVGWIVKVFIATVLQAITNKKTIVHNIRIKSSDFILDVTLHVILTETFLPLYLYFQ